MIVSFETNFYRLFCSFAIKAIVMIVVEIFVDVSAVHLSSDAHILRNGLR